MIRFKKILICGLIVSFLFPFELSRTEAASTTLSKTVEFFAGQDGNIRTDGSQFLFIFSNVMIPETNPSVKSAVVEINGVSYNSSGSQTINVDLEQNSLPAEVGADYVLAQNSKPKPFNIKHNAMGAIDPAISAYTLYLTGGTAAGARSFSVFSAKLVLTYQYSSSSSELLKTTKFFIEQKVNQVGTGVEASKPFSISVPEKSGPENIPLVRSVFVEIGGVARGNIGGTIEAKVAKAGYDPGYSLYNLDLASPSCGAACITPFVVRYDASSVVSGSDFPGSRDYTFYFRGTNFDTSLLSAKLILTYKYSDNISELPVSGYVISPTIDTGAVKGAAFNSMIWKGSLNGGKVRLQIATSDNVSGPWDVITDFKGPSCSGGSSDVYMMDSPDTPVEIMCANIHNNKRYFRYKVILCSSDCINPGLSNPEVTGVVVNWAP